MFWDVLAMYILKVQLSTSKVAGRGFTIPDPKEMGKVWSKQMGFLGIPLQKLSWQ